MTWFAVGAALVSAVTTLYASEKQAQAQEYNAQVAENNATLARQQAGQAEDDQRRRGRIAVGRQLAATSESGTGLTGSNLDLLRDSLYGVEADATNIRYEGALKASGLDAQATLNRFEAGATRTGGYLSAAGSLLKAGSSYTTGSGQIPTTSISGAQGGGYGTTGHQSAGGMNSWL